MTKSKMFETNQTFKKFEFWKFEFVSGFDIRISDFSTFYTSLIWLSGSPAGTMG
jgi:hypothetical protein